MVRRAHAAGPRVLVISGSVGAGHDGAAAELISRLRASGVPADGRDYLDALPRRWKYLLREAYVATVGYVPALFEWLFRGLEQSRGVQWAADRLCGLAREAVLDWIGDGYQVVVSTYPLASQTLGQLKALDLVRPEVVTFLTDPAVHHTWVHPAVEHHLTVTEATARMGWQRYRIPMRPVGGLVPRRFATPVCAERRGRLRAELGLPPGAPVALIVAGSLGLGEVPRAVRAIREARVADVVVLCGRNDRLRRRLSGADGVVALGWRSDVADLMGMADVLVHNAGGLSLTEALTAGLPAVTFLPIPGHGRANAEVLRTEGLAPWPRDEGELVAAVRAAVRGGRTDPRAVLREQDAASVVRELLARSSPSIPAPSQPAPTAPQPRLV